MTTSLRVLRVRRDRRTLDKWVVVEVDDEVVQAPGTEFPCHVRMVRGIVGKPADTEADMWGQIRRQGRVVYLPASTPTIDQEIAARRVMASEFREAAEAADAEDGLAFDLSALRDKLTGT